MKELWLIRHGQAPHNILFAQNRNLEAQNLRDPPLTKKGVQQATDLRFRLSSVIRDIELIIISPLRRTLMTSDIIFSKVKLPALVNTLPRERGDYSCDYGSPSSIIQQEFPHHDFSDLKEIWWTEKESCNHVIERVERFKEFLNQQPETRIAVVSHGFFLKTFLNNGRRCDNCECVRVMLDEHGNIFD